MSHGTDGVERLLASSSTLLGAFTVALPERRAPDASTVSHARAAKTVQWVASWLLRGSEMAVVIERTPFLSESREDLWQYYQTLPLDSRLDGLLGMLLAVEVLSSSGVLHKEQFPRSRQLLQWYCAAVGLAGVAPKQLFYHIHSWLWAYETRVALREVGPQMPSPLSTQAGRVISEAVASLQSALGVSDGPRAVVETTNRWASVLLLLSLGAAGFWWLGSSSIKDAADCAWQRLRWWFSKRKLGQ
mmetsp:Transcript_9206/g.19770  ORF Transcript_9206/g.19770 Transcript_9206/m.19770 type:complete len:245 (+) Transcript_9206:33-767(+)|eukprot:s5795_g6.t1